MEDGVLPKASSSDALTKRCVSIDLEVDPKTNKILSFAGVRNGFDRAFVYRRGDLAEALQSLDQFAETAEFVLAHNLINFDARLLEVTKPDLKLLKKPKFADSTGVFFYQPSNSVLLFFLLEKKRKRCES